MNGYNVTPKNVRPAAVVLAMVPILFVYPFAQKYFSKGFLVGSIKG
jgi:putative aldouronate transport system permease protein